ncbi:MAG: RNA polymerase sporulation sigma factor SigK [Firmicutes bacterium]|nr:RNA polymerase sporulation sigma factor SigK [Bacillota bacterium]
MIFESLITFLSKLFFFTGYVNNKGSFPEPLESEEEKKQLLLTKEGDMQAREILIKHNLRLVAFIVKKYHNAGEADDLLSVGSIGLIKGIETFEMGKGTQLATYCAKCIENEIRMHIRANKRHRNVRGLLDCVGTDKKGNPKILMDTLSTGEESIFQQVENTMVLEKVGELLYTHLTAREREIVIKRYGFDGRDKGLTQLEVAANMNISRSYVSRIEKKAIEKLSKVIVDGDEEKGSRGKK